MYASYSPPVSSSPPSSPGGYDSSPPTSPSRDEFKFDEDFDGAGPSIADPFAGDFKARIRKRTSSEGVLFNGSHVNNKRARIDSLPGPADEAEYDSEWEEEATLTQIEPDQKPEPDAVDPDEATWDKAAQEIIDNSSGSIDLTNLGLNSISVRAMKDLKCYTVIGTEPSAVRTMPPPALPLARDSKRRTSQTWSASHSRSKSFLAPSTTPNNDLEFHLFGNSITMIPKELCYLSRLGVLSLSQNMLQEIPPEICLLTNLRFLNVSGNRIRWLPAEILKMRLETLRLQPNPFLQPPSVKQNTPWPYTPILQRLSRPLPLVEVLLRRLVTTSRDSDVSLLEEYYNDPVKAGFKIPDHIHDALRACDSTSIPGPRRVYSMHNNAHGPADGLFDKHSYMQVTGFGRCNGIECKAATNTAQGIFVLPAEERFTWQPVAAQIAPGNGTELFPVRWRGCTHGCLADATMDKAEDEEDEFEDVGEVVPISTGDLDFSD